MGLVIVNPYCAVGSISVSQCWMQLVAGSFGLNGWRRMYDMICALVQQFLCPLSSRLFFQGGSGLQEVKGIDHSLHGLKSYSSEQWRSAAMIHEESSSIVGKVTSQSALFSLFKTQFLAHRPMFLENPASSFDLYNVCSIRSLAFRSVNSLTVPSLSCIKWFRCARCFSFREVTLQSCLCFIGYGWIGVHRWRLAVFQISFIFILPCYASLRVGIYLIVLSFIPSLPSSRLIYLSCTTSNFEFFLKISWSDNRASLVTYTSMCLRIAKSCLQVHVGWKM
jgi:hypothetical protein